jgi:hypothetical protein
MVSLLFSQFICKFAKIKDCDILDHFKTLINEKHKSG